MTGNAGCQDSSEPAPRKAWGEWEQRADGPLRRAEARLASCWPGG